LPKHSAGLLVFRPVDEGIEVLAVHPGGPFWAKKDDGAWSIPKGEIDNESEEPYLAARREFEEELGQPAPDAEPIDLGEVRQAGGKIVKAWGLLAGEDEVDPDAINSNTVELEWPRGTGRIMKFPEVDKAAWMSPDTARLKLIPAQVALVERLIELIGA
jgi:predicted NUDIX family NTP pyrophosphohydrolase